MIVTCQNCGKDVSIKDKDYVPGKYVYCAGCLQFGKRPISGMRERHMIRPVTEPGFGWETDAPADGADDEKPSP